MIPGKTKSELTHRFGPDGMLYMTTGASNGNERRRESMLRELGQRSRHVEQGPDGKLCLLTGETDGALLVIEPPDEQ